MVATRLFNIGIPDGLWKNLPATWKAAYQRLKQRRCGSRHGSICPNCPECPHRRECHAPRMRCGHRINGSCSYWLSAEVDPRSWSYCRSLDLHAIDTYGDPPCIEAYRCPVCRRDLGHLLRDPRYAKRLADLEYLRCDNCGEEWYPPAEVGEEDEGPPGEIDQARHLQSSEHRSAAEREPGQ